LGSGNLDSSLYEEATEKTAEFCTKSLVLLRSLRCLGLILCSDVL